VLFLKIAIIIVTGLIFLRSIDIQKSTRDIIVIIIDIKAKIAIIKGIITVIEGIDLVTLRKLTQTVQTIRKSLKRDLARKADGLLPKA
jgi:hypothetical protein